MESIDPCRFAEWNASLLSYTVSLSINGASFSCKLPLVVLLATSIAGRFWMFSRSSFLQIAVSSSWMTLNHYWGSEVNGATSGQTNQTLLRSVRDWRDWMFWVDLWTTRRSGHQQKGSRQMRPTISRPLFYVGKEHLMATIYYASL